MPVRKGRRNDVSAIAALEQTLFSCKYPISRRSLIKLVHSPTAKVIVAEYAGEFAGCAIVLFRRTSSIARLYTIGRVPARKGRGIGLELLQAAEHAALVRHCTSIRLEVCVVNRRALRLYRARGYREFARRLNYYPSGADALRLEKHLTPPRKAMHRTSTRDA